MAIRTLVGVCAGASLLALGQAATAQDHTHRMPAPAAASPAPHDMSSHDAMASDAAHAMPMTSPYGDWPMSRDASGTSWRPDAGDHGGVHAMRGVWMLMTHALLNVVYDRQSGPRGGDKTFVAGMLMTSARRDFDDGSTLNLRAMLSPDPLMGKSGYPLLLAAGETADGVTPLVDRQHPHDAFM